MGHVSAQERIWSSIRGVFRGFGNSVLVFHMSTILSLQAIQSDKGRTVLKREFSRLSESRKTGQEVLVLVQVRLPTAHIYLYLYLYSY